MTKGDLTMKMTRELMEELLKMYARCHGLTYEDDDVWALNDEDDGFYNFFYELDCMREKDSGYWDTVFPDEDDPY